MDYKILARRNVYEGFFQMQRIHVEHETFSGNAIRIERECMERGDAVVVVLHDPRRDSVLLIEQFRIGPAVRRDDPWLIEVVAGMLHPGEDPLACARRECIEEAGYAPDTLTPIGSFYVSPGGTSERLFLYLGEVDSARPVGSGGGLASEHEDIRCFWVPREEALAMVRDGRIHSSGPMLALLLAFGIGVATN